MDMPLARNVVLIDFENVQPPSLKELAAPGFKVLVFVGASQTRISMDVAEAMQALGSQGALHTLPWQRPQRAGFPYRVPYR